MEETPTSDNSINFNNLSNNDEKNTKDIDEIVIQKLMGTCEAVAMAIFSFFFIQFIYPIILIWFYTPYKKIIFFDKINKVLILGYRGICGCRIRKCPCEGINNKIYDLSQIQKVKIYRTSQPDPNKGFNKLYFINCDIYSNDGQMESLIEHIPFNQDKYDEVINFFQKYINTEVIPLEVDINTYDVNNNNNYLYP